MAASGFKRVELLFWAVLPGLIAFLLTLLFFIPKPLVGIGAAMPPLAISAIFFWGLLHPKDMPYWFAFALGLLVDALQGLPLGISSFGYMLFLLLVESQRKYIIKEGFMAKWGYFAVLLFMIMLLMWLLIWLITRQMPVLLPVAIQWALTVCFYPLLHQLYDKIFEHSNHRRWQIAHGR